MDEAQLELNVALGQELMMFRPDVVEKVEDLLEKGADPKWKDSLGYDALMNGCLYGGTDFTTSASIVKLLMPLCDLDTVDIRGWSAITLAARIRNVGAVMELLDGEVPMPADKEGKYPWMHTKDAGILALFEAAELKRAIKNKSNNRSVEKAHTPSI